MRTVAWIILLSALAGCATAPPPVIAEPYPRLDSATACLDFFRLAARLDDPQAGYHCLSDRTREQVTFSDFVTGWAWYREYFELFGDARVVGRRRVEGGELLTLELLRLQEPFHFVEQRDGWRLRIPSRYNQRTLEQLFAELKRQAAQKSGTARRRRLERRGG